MLNEKRLCFNVGNYKFINVYKEIMQIYEICLIYFNPGSTIKYFFKGCSVNMQCDLKFIISFAQSSINLITKKNQRFKEHSRNELLSLS